MQLLALSAFRRRASSESERRGQTRPYCDIPFNKPVLSQSNVRRMKVGVSIVQLAESIAQRTLVQSLTVCTAVDADGQVRQALSTRVTARLS